MSRAWVLVVVAGCGFSTEADERIHRSFQRLSIGNKVVLAPQDLSGFDATFLAPDDTSPDGLVRTTAEHVDGGWAAALATAAQLQFTLPDFPTPLLRFVDFPQPRVTSVFSVLEHPNPQFAPFGSTLTLDVQLDRPQAGSESLLLYSVGSWGQLGIPNASTVGVSLAMTVPHESMLSLSGRPHSAFTRDDAVFVFRIGGGAVTGVVAFPPFDEAVTNPLAGTMVPVGLDQQLAVQIDRDVAVTRLGAVTPALTAVGANWQLTAAPGALYAQGLGPPLGGGSLAPGAKMISASYGNPFDWQPLLFWQASGSRVVQTRTLPVTLVGGMYEYRLAAAGGTSTLPAGLPQAVTFDGTPLTADNRVLPRPTRPVEIKFLSDRPENTGVCSLALYELVPGPLGNALTYKFVTSFTAVEPRFLVPPEVFVPDHLYVLRAVTTTGGYDADAFAAGDLTKRTLPYAVGYFDAAVFEVR